MEITGYHERTAISVTKETSPGYLPEHNLKYLIEKEIWRKVKFHDWNYETNIAPNLPPPKRPKTMEEEVRILIDRKKDKLNKELKDEH